MYYFNFLTGDILVFSALLFYPPSLIYTTLHFDNISSGNRYCKLCTNTKKTWFNLETYRLFVCTLTYLINMEGGINKGGGQIFFYYIKHKRRGCNFFITSNSAWRGTKPEKKINETPCLLDAWMKVGKCK